MVLALAVVATAPAARATPPPTAQASGSDVVELTYPSIVKVPVARATRAMRRASRKIENDKPDEAARPLTVVRRQIAKAWRGAKYKIRTAPPPPAEDARSGRRASASGDGPTGPAYASPADTGFRVLTLQHDVAAELTQLLEDAPEASYDALATTLQFTLGARDVAIADIVRLAPPAPSDEDPDADDASVPARASGDGPVVTTFETLMPDVVPQLDDEIDAIQAITSDSPELTEQARALLGAAGMQIEQTKAVVNLQWPPVPPED